MAGAHGGTVRGVPSISPSCRRQHGIRTAEREAWASTVEREAEWVTGVEAEHGCSLARIAALIVSPTSTRGCELLRSVT